MKFRINFDVIIILTAIFYFQYSFSQNIWVDCEKTVSALDFYLQPFIPKEFCSRLEFIRLPKNSITAIEKISNPVINDDQELLSFVDLKSLIPSIHLLVWYGRTNIVDSGFMETLNLSSNEIFESNSPTFDDEFEILLDGNILSASKIPNTRSWRNSKWESLVAGVQVVPFPTYGIGLVSIHLTEAGRKHVEHSFNSAAPLDALIQWRIKHNFNSAEEPLILASNGHFSCLEKSRKIFKPTDIEKLHPIIKILPVDIANFQVLRSCM